MGKSAATSRCCASAARSAGRVVLGRFEGSLIAAEDRASTLVMGPTQLAGKSSRVVIPAILEWDGPVLTTSIKRDTLDATLPRRQELGEVKVFDPLGRTGIPTATWSPVAAAASWTQAREVAAHLMQVGWEQAKHDKDPHWRPAAARHLAPLLLAANAGGRRSRTSDGGSIPPSATNPSSCSPVRSTRTPDEHGRS